MFTTSAVVASGAASAFGAQVVSQVAKRLDAVVGAQGLESISGQGRNLKLAIFAANPTIEEVQLAVRNIIPCCICHVSVRFVDIGVEVSYGSEEGIVPHPIGAYPTAEITAID
eukprot:3313766-Karenia_brevis.AAC.1